MITNIVVIGCGQLWFPYKGGIMSGCCNTELAHAVLIVGYGVDHGTDYWIIKNVRVCACVCVCVCARARVLTTQIIVEHSQVPTPTKPSCLRYA